jgi:hypothetical protein
MELLTHNIGIRAPGNKGLGCDPMSDGVLLVRPELSARLNGKKSPSIQGAGAVWRLYGGDGPGKRDSGPF